MRDGTELPGAKKTRVVGLIQPTYQSDYSDALSDLEGNAESLNDKRAFYSGIAPGYSSTSSFYLFRVRFGVRGLVGEHVNYELVGEYGANALTTIPGGSNNVALAEGSVTLNYIRGLRTRFGLFKVPGSEESLRSAIDYVNFTQVTQFLINSQPLKFSDGLLEYESSGLPAVPRSGVRAFRDTGVQIFDAFSLNNFEYGYAFMVGSGNTLNQTDDNNRLTQYGRLQMSYLFHTPNSTFKTDRPDFTFFVWGQRDFPTFENKSYEQERWGTGFTFFRDGYHLNAEYMYGRGMIYLAPYYVNDPGRLFTSKRNDAYGWYIDVGKFITKNIQLEARYDVFEQDVESNPYSREFNTLTLGAQYYFSRNTRIAVNYEIRDYKLGGGNGGGSIDSANAKRVADAIGNRLGVQLTLKF